MPKYLVILLDAEVPSPKARSMLREGLAISLKITRDEADSLLGSLPAILKRDLDRDQAEKYCSVLERFGAVVEVMEDTPTEQTQADRLGEAVDPRSLATPPDPADDEPYLDDLTDMLAEALEQDPDTGSIFADLRAQDKPAAKRERPATAPSALKGEHPTGLELFLDQQAADSDTGRAVASAPSASTHAHGEIYSEQTYSAAGVIAESHEPGDSDRSNGFIDDSHRVVDLTQEFSGIPVFSKLPARELPDTPEVHRKRGFVDEHKGSLLALTGAVLVLGVLGLQLAASGSNRGQNIIEFSSDFIERLLREQHDILGQGKQANAPTANIVRWMGQGQSGTIDARVTVEARDDVFYGRLDLTSPPVAERTPAELVAGTPPRVWLRRLVAENLTLNKAQDSGTNGSPSVADNASEPGSNKEFQLTGIGRAYLSDELVSGGRAAVNVSMTGRLSADGRRVTGTWRVDHSTAEAHSIDSDPVIERSGSVNYRIILRGDFTASLVNPQ